MTIKELVGQTNAYIVKKEKAADQSANRGLLKNVALYITEIFDILGLISTPEQIGFSSSTASGQVANVREFMSWMMQ